MDEVIKTICNALQEEAEAVKSNTDRLSVLASHGIETSARAIAKNRLDAVEHIQNLTIELTKLFYAGVSSEEKVEGDSIES